MKKWMMAALVCAAALAGFFYLLMPDRITIRRSVTVRVNQHAIRRLLIENNQWDQGWGDNETSIKKGPGQAVVFNGTAYTLVDKKYNSLVIAIHRGDHLVANSSLNVIPLSKDSILLDWEATVPGTKNPRRYLKIYQESKKLEQDMDTLLQRMGSFYSKPLNVYGIGIRQVAIVDTTLLSTDD